MKESKMNDIKYTTGSITTIPQAVAEFLAVATMGLRAYLQETYGDGWTFTPTIARARPNLKDAAIFDGAPTTARNAMDKLNAAATNAFGAIIKIHEKIAAGATRTTKPDGTYSYTWKEDAADWDCSDLVNAQHEANFYLHQMCSQVAALHCATHDFFSTIELIQICEPHPCDDPKMLGLVGAGVKAKAKPGRTGRPKGS
jgi:hypothetical protein